MNNDTVRLSLYDTCVYTKVHNDNVYTLQVKMHNCCVPNEDTTNERICEYTQ